VKWSSLRDADLSEANLYKAIFLWSNLTGALLCGALMIDTNLRRANLRDADFTGANLSGAIMPDGTANAWTSSEDV